MLREVTMICAFCGSALIYVHGHATCGQGACPMFGVNQAECCSGETVACGPLTAEVRAPLLAPGALPTISPEKGPTTSPEKSPAAPRAPRGPGDERP